LLLERVGVGEQLDRHTALEGDHALELGVGELLLQQVQ